MAQPDPRIIQAGLINDTDVALQRVLLSAATDAERLLRRRASTFSGQVSQAQLSLVIAELKVLSHDLWQNKIPPAIARQIAAAESAAAFGVDQLDQAIVSATRDRDLRNALLASQRQRAKRVAEIARARENSAKFDLSPNVYKWEALTNGIVERNIASAIARGATANDIARSVRDLIDPNVRGGISYAAKRTGRTEVANAYHRTTIREYTGNPFVRALQWHLSRSHPKSDICDSLSGKRYDPLETPSKPHPQCLCYLTPVPITDKQFREDIKSGNFDLYLRNKYPDIDVNLGTRLRVGDNVIPRPGDRVKLPGKQGVGTVRETSRDGTRVWVDTDTGGRVLVKPSQIKVIQPSANPGLIIRTPKVTTRSTVQSKTSVIDTKPSIKSRGDELVDDMLKRQSQFVPKSAADFGGITRLQGQSAKAFASEHGGDALGGYDRASGQIITTPQLFGLKYQAAYRKDVKSGWFSQSDETVSGIDNFMAHEFGHYLHDRVLRAGVQATKGIWDEIADAFGLKRSSFYDARSLDRWVERNRAILSKGVSRYGATESAELLGEVWAEYSTNPNARPAIKRIGKVLAEAAERVG